MKTFKKALFVTVAAVCVAFVTGCGAKGIVGSWAHGSYVYTFNEDKTCQYDVGGTIMKCTYTTDGDKLSILYDGNTASFDTTYKIDGNKLIIKDSFDNDVEYTRK